MLSGFLWCALWYDCPATFLLASNVTVKVPLQQELCKMFLTNTNVFWKFPLHQSCLQNQRKCSLGLSTCFAELLFTACSWNFSSKTALFAEAPLTVNATESGGRIFIGPLPKWFPIQWAAEWRKPPQLTFFHCPFLTPPLLSLSLSYKDKDQPLLKTRHKCGWW